ncbi:hypothetical protein L3i20_v249630 [Paenibacillus sp. L3-i20]|nr:hypothetical protein L3i20_v249630 [Paenibacillus sp. L3-i20]
MNHKDLNLLIFLPGPKCPVLMHTLVEKETKPKKKLNLFKRKR